MRTISLLFFAAALQGQTIRIFWAPIYTHDLTTGKTTEALYIHPSPALEITVKIEATLDGKPLPVAEGHVDDVTWEIDAPIRNLNTYKLVRLTIRTEGREWVFENPKQELQLSSTVNNEYPDSRKGKKGAE
jgi:hypothetical protein